MVSPTKPEKDQLKEEESSTSDQSDIENAEDSSNSEASENDPSTFDVVMDAIKDDSEEDDETESSSEEGSDKSEDEDKTKSEDEEDADDVSEEELKAWKPKTRERFEKLQAKYRGVSEENTELKGKLEQAETDAGYYRQFVEYLDTNRISQDEANQLFHIGALMKNDPVRALELITPYYNDLLYATGNVIPADLQEQVQKGYMTRQHALELSRHRMANQTNQAIQQERTQYQQQREARQQQENVNSIQSAIANWEKQISVSDLDYAKKKDRVLERVELMLVRAQREGNPPQTVEQALELANKAKAEVDAEFKQYRPRKPVNTVTGGGSNTSQPDPKDTRDVIRRTLNQ